MVFYRKKVKIEKIFSPNRLRKYLKTPILQLINSSILKKRILHFMRKNSSKLKTEIQGFPISQSFSKIPDVVGCGYLFEKSPTFSSRRNPRIFYWNSTTRNDWATRVCYPNRKSYFRKKSLKFQKELDYKSFLPLIFSKNFCNKILKMFFRLKKSISHKRVRSDKSGKISTIEFENPTNSGKMGPLRSPGDTRSFSQKIFLKKEIIYPLSKRLLFDDW